MNRKSRSYISAAAEHATGRYAAKLARGLTGRRSDGDVDEQTERFRAAAEHADLRTVQLREVLWDRGVHSTLYCVYRAFTLHVDKLVRHYEHETLRLMVAHAVARWTCHGCRPEVLTAVCRKVFGLTTPSVGRNRE